MRLQLDQITLKSKLRWNRLKGQSSYPFSMIEAAFTFLLVIGVAYSMQGYVANYITEETTDIRADRVQRGAQMLQHYSNGYLEMDISDYQFKTQGMTFSIKYGDKEHERELTGLGYSTLDGPTEYTEYSQLCLIKSGDELSLEEEC